MEKGINKLRDNLFCVSWIENICIRAYERFHTDVPSKLHTHIVLNSAQSTEQLSRIGADLNTVNKDLSMQVGDLRRKLRCCDSSDDGDDDGGCGGESNIDLFSSSVWGSNNARTIDACLAAADQV